MQAHRTHKGRKTQDLTGQTFHYLAIKEFAGYQDGRAYWLCECRCGSIKPYPSTSLLRQNTKSCGCLKLEKLQARKKHDEYVIDIPEYGIYHNMIRRCTDPTNHSYGRYGARGITIAPEWLNSFETFLSDMGPRPGPQYTLERISNNGPYNKDNCRWATATEQARNRTNNVYVTFANETRCISDWAEKIGIDEHTLADRIQRYGWSIEEALTTPARPLQSRQDMPLTFRGETHTLSEWCQSLGFDEKSIAERILRQGWSVERALTTPVRTKDAPLTYNGLTLSTNEWGARLGIDPETLRKRLRKGMSVEETLTTPLRKRGN